MMSVPDTQTCPRCKTLTDSLISIDAGMRLALKSASEAGEIPEKVCPACFDQLTGAVSQGLKLRMEADLREKNKMMMWKSRVNLIKNARNLMTQKAYSEAAVQYEKYIRIMEVVHNVKKGELTPSIFNNSNRSKEMTVVASVYWDLLRIYDTNPRYGERMASAAKKCAEFLPFSTIYPDIVKKAEQFARSAKNPAIVDQFLKLIKARRGPCFIADAAFAGYPEAPELTVLRQYREFVLAQSVFGRLLIRVYYKTSPPLARGLRRSQSLSAVSRFVLAKISACVKKSLNSD